MDIAAIVQLLADRIEALVEHLLPGGKIVQRRYWRCGSVAGEQGKSLIVNLVGHRRGRWKDFASGERGDPLDLIAAAECNGELGAAIKWAKAWLGIEDEELDPEERRRRDERAARRRDERQRQAEREALNRHQDAKRLWLAAKPLEFGDIVDRYLDGRGIDLRRLSRLPRALRAHSRLRHPDGGAWPAMVAAITDIEGRHVASHRTWLEARNLACEDRPTVGKAPVETPKMGLGDYHGGFVRLWRANGVVPWGQAEAGDVLILGEGVEDVLSYVQERPQHFAACTVGLSTMLSVELPVEFTTVCLLTQNDAEGSAAAKLLPRVVARLRAEGRDVMAAPRNGIFKDHNDRVRSLLAGGASNHERRAARA
jgi:hypothetical protein